MGAVSSDTLNSPQGDGNTLMAYGLSLWGLGQTPSIPRKGTETPGKGGFVTGQIAGQTPSIPRKGTETLLQVPPFLFFF